MSDAPLRHVIGAMTGTSLDGLDLALVQLQGRGLELTARLLEAASVPLGDLTTQLRALAEGEPRQPLAYLRAARALGELHAHAAAHLLARHPGVRLDFFVAHGQTIWHAPQENLSWQLMDPWPIARRLNVPVCYDLRQADLIAQGQGAPITPLCDWLLFRSARCDRLIVNLGGICNVTLLPRGSTPDRIAGEDIGPCNLLLDGLTRRLSGAPMDVDGQLAQRGHVLPQLYDRLRVHPFFQRPRPRTTGREDFSGMWLDELVRTLPGTPTDLLASAADAVGRLVAQALPSGGPCELLLAGGGAHNPALRAAIARHLPSTAQVLEPETERAQLLRQREPVAMALLGALSADGVPITLPGITGARQPGAAGAWVNLPGPV